MFGCQKKYTDPSSLRKHVKNHTQEEQDQVKQTKNSNKARSKDANLERWFEADALPSGPMALLSGGGVVVDNDYAGQMVEFHHHQPHQVWARRQDQGAGYRERGEDGDNSTFYKTPLYLEV